MSDDDVDENIDLVPLVDNRLNRTVTRGQKYGTPPRGLYGFGSNPPRMATVLEFASPAADFPLGSIFEALPEVEVKLERLIPHDTLIIPYFWVRGIAVEDIEAEFKTHTGVTDIRLIDSVEDEYLMRAEWENDYVGVLAALSEAKVTLLTCVGTKDGWHFEVRGESQTALSEFRSICQKSDTQIEVTALHAMRPVQGEGFELTDTQREALVLAYERGYFNSPRESSLEAVAEELGITQQSLSSRLRRGHRRLIENTLIDI